MANEDVLKKFEANLPKMREFIKTNQLKNERFVFKLDAVTLSMTREKKSFWF